MALAAAAAAAAAVVLTTTTMLVLLMTFREKVYPAARVKVAKMPSAAALTSSRWCRWRWVQRHPPTT
jgi:hypothetical protein